MLKMRRMCREEWFQTEWICTFYVRQHASTPSRQPNTLMSVLKDTSLRNYNHNTIIHLNAATKKKTTSIIKATSANSGYSILLKTQSDCFYFQFIYTMPIHNVGKHCFSQILLNYYLEVSMNSWKYRVVSRSLLHGFECRVLLLVDWLLHKSKEPNLLIIFNP